VDNAVHRALAVAFRHYDDPTTSEEDRDAILAAVVQHFDGDEAETASRILHHREEARARQMQLRGLLASK
jgi:hypothetical protein